MFSAIIAAAARYPRWILSGAVLVAVGFATTGLLFPRDSVGRFYLVPTLAALGIVSAATSVVAFLRKRPAAFIVDPAVPAFRTRQNPARVLQAVMLTLLLSLEIVVHPPLTTVGPSSDQGPHLLWGAMNAVLLGFTVLMGIIVVLVNVLCWRGIGVRLEPTGLIDVGPLGTLTVPWDALAPGYPLLAEGMSTSFLGLPIARPDLVHHRGVVLTRRSVRADNIDATFLAFAITRYLAAPTRRAVIGTQLEYDDLLRPLTPEPTHPL